MSLTSRSKRTIRRVERPLRDSNLIIIFSEGKETEKQYFESELFFSSRVKVKVMETQNGLSAPIHVFRRMKSFIRDVDIDKNDQLWLVIDVDRWPVDQLDHVTSESIKGKNKAKLAVSNPSFELWLYLHNADWVSGNCTAADIESALRSLFGGYNKSKLNIDNFRDCIDVAIQRSKNMNVSGRWPDNPGTHVYKLVEEILKLR